ncbi:MAG TPA: hypothetical protein VJA18_02915 [Candidatus Nanoarchaeia archaeon]|nr:hypothetical protein [Candidatus Nanoarchaeia archaeon]
MPNRKIITITGASGTGKSTLAGELIKNSELFQFLTSTTTRPARETDHPREYEHVTPNQFSWLALGDEFAWHQEFAGEWYGTKSAYLAVAQSAAYTSLMILIPERVKTLREHVSPDLIISFYIVSPPESATQRSRLEQRGDTAQRIEQRLREREWDAEAASSGIPYLFITNNGTIEEAVEQIRKYLK